jgi:hypothetical protein
MCNACGFICCASDEFEGCGCDTCGVDDCLEDCQECGEKEIFCACDCEEDFL